MRHQPASGSTVFAVSLVVSLFFLWGLSYGLLDVLNKHFQETLHIGKRESALLQTAYFGAYFLMALPAGYLMRRTGYKSGVIVGLLLFAAGACLFYPAQDFRASLMALFVLACGLTFLETAANPFMTVLGPPETAAFRLNLAQSFNGVGSFIGPLIGGQLFFNTVDAVAGMDQVRSVYLAIAAIVLVIAAMFYFTRMPEPSEPSKTEVNPDHKPLFRESRLMRAVTAQFFYVAAQVGVAAFFINYCTSEHIRFSNVTAAYFLSIALVVFTIGRFAGTALMKRIAAEKLLFRYSVINVLLCAWIAAVPHPLSVVLLIAVFFFESIMFPTIFAVGIKGMGPRTKTASSVLVMSIVGGALVPYVMGIVAERYSTPLSFLIPMICFLVVAWFGKSQLKTTHP